MNASQPTTGPSAQPEEPSRAPARTRAQELVTESKETIRHFGQEARKEMTKPTTGAAIAGAVVVGAAIVWGLPEAAIGAAAAYVVYRILEKRPRAA
jgi:hypothetical protein